MATTILLSTLKPLGKKNPRYIKDIRFQQLKKSIKEFPEMMELRPMVIDKTNIIIAGNMKYNALMDMGYTEIPATWVKKALHLTEEQRDRFIIVDNDHAGQWDYDALANEWDQTCLADWGLTIPDVDEGSPVSFKARKVPKGCLLKVICDDPDAAGLLAERLIKEKYQVEIK